MSFSGINISNNEAGGLHSAFPTWWDFTDKSFWSYATHLGTDIVLILHIIPFPGRINLSSLCQPVWPSTPPAGLKYKSHLQGWSNSSLKMAKKSFLELNKYTSWDAGSILIKKCTYVKLWRKILMKIYSLVKNCFDLLGHWPSMSVNAEHFY